MERCRDDPATGEAPTCRSPAQQGAQDQGRITEEPCARKPAHGFEAETGSDSLVYCNRTGGTAAVPTWLGQTQVSGGFPARR